MSFINADHPGLAYGDGYMSGAGTLGQVVKVAGNDQFAVNADATARSFGILRKELTLILLASVLGTTNFALVLTPVQMFVFAFVVMVYVPCIATIGALVKEFGLKKALTMSLVEIALAVFLGGVISRVLLLANFF